MAKDVDPKILLEKLKKQAAEAKARAEKLEAIADKLEATKKQSK